MKYLLLLLTMTATVHAENALELLKESDKARGAIGDGLSWALTIDTEEDGEASSREFDVKVKGPDALVEASAPARNKGEVYIFNDRNMWFYKPTLKKPVAISARQKLTGQAANGDIASTNYARDYDPTIEKTEDINKEKFFVLMLKAKTDNLTYDKIRYWISAKSKLAIKAEFLNLQGQAFKIGELTYKNSIKAGGKTIPFVSELKITDAKFPKNISIIKYKNPKAEKLSDSIFNVNNLSR
ncbi:MAG: hypothetical protein B7Y39_08745 [Bdellovibrio sp. 28-41-41]|nr:MAG: hypothetical protein B7Y39_08745 [Bdellovibrio sp. 28-41-41]